MTHVKSMSALLFDSHLWHTVVFQFKMCRIEKNNDQNCYFEPVLDLAFEFQMKVLKLCTRCNFNVYWDGCHGVHHTLAKSHLTLKTFWTACRLLYCLQFYCRWSRQLFDLDSSGTGESALGPRLQSHCKGRMLHVHLCVKLTYPPWNCRGVSHCNHMCAHQGNDKYKLTRKQLMGAEKMCLLEDQSKTFTTISVTMLFRLQRALAYSQ